MKSLITIFAVSILSGCASYTVPVIDANLDPKLAINPTFEMSEAEQYAAYRPTQSCEEIRWNITHSRMFIERAEKESAHSASAFFWTLNLANGTNKWNGLKLAKKNLEENKTAYAARCTKA